jgi:hypothetical protein
MSEDLKDILSNLNPDIDQETLLLYLQGKLSAEKQHEVEKQLIDQDFDSDAIDGLQEIKDKKNISLMVEQLTRDLKKKIDKRKRSGEKPVLRMEPWLIIAIVLILLIAIIGYVIIHKSLSGHT